MACGGLCWLPGVQGVLTSRPGAGCGSGALWASRAWWPLRCCARGCRSTLHARLAHASCRAVPDPGLRPLQRACPCTEPTALGWASPSRLRTCLSLPAWQQPSASPRPGDRAVSPAEARQPVAGAAAATPADEGLQHGLVRPPALAPLLGGSAPAGTKAQPAAARQSARAHGPAGQLMQGTHCTDLPVPLQRA